MKRLLSALLISSLILITSAQVGMANSQYRTEDFRMEPVEDADTELIRERFEELTFEGKLDLLRSLYEANQVYQYAQSLLREDAGNTQPYQEENQLREFTRNIRRTLRSVLDNYTDRISFETQYKQVLTVMKLEHPDYQTEDAHQILERFNRVLEDERSNYDRYAVISALDFL